MIADEELYQANLRLNREEWALRRVHLLSMPRYLSVVIGTACNIHCSYCYQTKAPDNLLSPEFFGDHLRRELSAFYPFLSTLRVQGGEAFMIPGFAEFVEEVSATVNRPILSTSTNGTLLNQAWAERIVEIPFQCVTVSIDGATPSTYERLRQGASLHQVLANIERIQNLKNRRNSSLPDIDAFFLVMRSTYREIPLFLQLIRGLGIERVVFQILLVDDRNLSRDPGLSEEVNFDLKETRELYEITRSALEQGRKQFKNISVSGFHSLFERHGLEAGFLDEGRFSIYPDSDPGASGDENAGDSGQCSQASGEARETGQSSPTGLGAIPLCPNPWTLMYITETGDVHICSMCVPVGNLYETPLIRLWNSPKAVAARSDMISGHYRAAGCSEYFCGWREGKRVHPPAQFRAREAIDQFKLRTQQALKAPEPLIEPSDSSLRLASIRRMLTQRTQRIAELESNLAELRETNQLQLESAERANRSLAERVAALEHRLPSEPPPAGDIRFGKNPLARMAKKIAIGSAIRCIRMFDAAGQALRKFVRWVCYL